MITAVGILARCAVLLCLWQTINAQEDDQRHVAVIKLKNAGKTDAEIDAYFKDLDDTERINKYLEAFASDGDSASIRAIELVRPTPELAMTLVEPLLWKILDERAMASVIDVLFRTDCIKSLPEKDRERIWSFIRVGDNSVLTERALKAVDMYGPYSGEHMSVLSRITADWSQRSRLGAVHDLADWPDSPGAAAIFQRLVAEDRDEASFAAVSGLVKLVKQDSLPISDIAQGMVTKDFLNFIPSLQHLNDKEYASIALDALISNKSQMTCRAWLVVESARRELHNGQLTIQSLLLLGAQTPNYVKQLANKYLMSFAALDESTFGAFAGCVVNDDGQIASRACGILLEQGAETHYFLRAIKRRIGQLADGKSCDALWGYLEIIARNPDSDESFQAELIALLREDAMVYANSGKMAMAHLRAHALSVLMAVSNDPDAARSVIVDMLVNSDMTVEQITAIRAIIHMQHDRENLVQLLGKYLDASKPDLIINGSDLREQESPMSDDRKMNTSPRIEAIRCLIALGNGLIKACEVPLEIISRIPADPYRAGNLEHDFQYWAAQALSRLK